MRAVSKRNEAPRKASLKRAALRLDGGELAAGSRDIAAAGESNRRRYVRPIEHRLEHGDRVSQRTVVHPRGVVRDQVDFEGVLPEDLRELLRMLGSVVDACEHDVLDEDFAASELDVATALGEDVFEGIAVVHWHEPTAQRVCWSME